MYNATVLTSQMIPSSTIGNAIVEVVPIGTEPTTFACFPHVRMRTCVRVGQSAKHSVISTQRCYPILALAVVIVWVIGNQ